MSDAERIPSRELLESLRKRRPVQDATKKLQEEDVYSGSLSDWRWKIDNPSSRDLLKRLREPLNQRRLTEVFVEVLSPKTMVTWLWVRFLRSRSPIS